jgi:hypothetical protein
MIVLRWRSSLPILFNCRSVPTVDFVQLGDETSLESQKLFNRELLKIHGDGVIKI